MLEPEVSEMSCISQSVFTVSGFEMGPRRIDGEKHSLIVEISLSDFCQEYHKQASPVSKCLKIKNVLHEENLKLNGLPGLQ